MDEIRIEDLEIFARHGVFPEENVLGQKFVVSAVLYTDTRKAGTDDNLEESIHYGIVCHEIQEFMQANQYKLIETVAEKTAEMLLMKYSLLKKIRLEIKKPWAPVGLPLRTVSVAIERGWHTAYIALGSNMGDKEGYLRMAVEELSETEGCRMGKVSGFIRTEPYGVLDQDEFLNGALRMETLLTPEELLDRLHEIEQKAERKRIIHWGPRTLDLDILFYDDLIMSSEELVIPHVEIQKRDFVLRPLCEIAPYLRHPVSHKTMQELLDELHAGETRTEEA